MTGKNTSLDGATSVRIRRGRVESVDLFEIKDSELEALERGTPAELQLNFALVLLTTAFAAITTLITTSFDKEVVRTVYILIAIVCVIIGVYLLISWGRTRGSIKRLCKQIRERIPPDVVAATRDEEADASTATDEPDAMPPPQG